MLPEGLTSRRSRLVALALLIAVGLAPGRGASSIGETAPVMSWVWGQQSTTSGAISEDIRVGAVRRLQSIAMGVVIYRVETTADVKTETLIHVFGDTDQYRFDPITWSAGLLARFTYADRDVWTYYRSGGGWTYGGHRHAEAAVEVDVRWQAAEGVPTDFATPKIHSYAWVPFVGVETPPGLQRPAAATGTVWVDGAALGTFSGSSCCSYLGWGAPPPPCTTCIGYAPAPSAKTQESR